MLDAPVSGSVPQVQSGTLTIMVGGTRGLCARRAAPARLGTPTRIGENGQGLALKLAINISLAVQMLAFSEGLLLAERDGVDPALAAEVMTQSAIGSPMLKARAPLVLDLPDEAWFDVGLMRKDVVLALEAARERTPVPAGVADEILTRRRARLRAPGHRRAVRGARRPDPGQWLSGSSTCTDVPAPRGLGTVISPPEGLHAVLQSDEAGAWRRIRPAGTVVADGDAEHTIGRLHVNVDGQGPRVLRGVRQHLETT